jgi:hypothetical protein
MKSYKKNLNKKKSRKSNLKLRKSRKSKKSKKSTMKGGTVPSLHRKLTAEEIIKSVGTVETQI